MCVQSMLSPQVAPKVSRWPPDCICFAYLDKRGLAGEMAKGKEDETRLSLKMHAVSFVGPRGQFKKNLQHCLQKIVIYHSQAGIGSHLSPSSYCNGF